MRTASDGNNEDSQVHVRSQYDCSHKRQLKSTILFLDLRLGACATINSFTSKPKLDSHLDIYTAVLTLTIGQAVLRPSSGVSTKQHTQTTIVGQSATYF